MRVSEAIAIRLREVLRMKEMSKYRLEMDSGVAAATVKDILNATREGGNVKVIITLIRALGISVAEFFDSPLFESDDLILN